MEGRFVFDVMPSHEKGWTVTRRGSHRPSGRMPRKSDAISQAKELAKRHPLGQVVVHGLDGRIQMEYTYGKDSRRTKG